MKNLTKIFTLLMFVQANLNCKIIESSTIRDVLRVVKLAKSEKVLAIFDIDNTLARGRSLISRDEFFSAKVQSFMVDGMHDHHAVNQFLPTYYYIQFHSPLELVENDSLSVLELLSESGVATMALTARSSYLAERTHDQLKKLGIKFSFFNNESFPFNLRYPSLYKDGMLFCGLNDKGDSLLALFEKLDYKPDLIVFVDDKHKNLISVESKFVDSAIQFEGLRLNACDDDVNNFDLARAEQELLDFKDFVFQNSL